MSSFKDLEDSLKKFMLDEQSDAHNVRNVSVAKYNNLKVSMDASKYQIPHFIIRITISEAVFSLADCAKINGGLGYDERFVIKWFGRMRIKDKLRELWDTVSQQKEDKV